VNLDGVAGTELRDVATQAGCIDDVELLHDFFALCARYRSWHGYVGDEFGVTCGPLSTIPL
jgi:hypothetical protein